MRLHLPALLLVLLVATGVAAPGIYQYRGDPRHTGMAPEGESLRLPVVRAWSYERVNVGIHTASKSSPVSDGESLLVGADNERFYALDLVTGKLRWRWESRPCKHGIHATAAGDATRVYVPDYGGYLTALDRRTGEPAWEVKLGGSIGASPTILGDRIYLGVETRDPDGFLAVVDRATGRLLFEGPRMGDHTHATPTIDPVNLRVYMGSNLGFFHCYDGTTGEELWRFRCDGALDTLPRVKKPPKVHGQIKSTAALVGERVLFTSWDRHVYCLDARTGARRWRHRTGGLAMSSPSVDVEAGRVYVGSHDGEVRALDLETGDVVWKFDTGKRVIASPLVVPLEGRDGKAVVVGSHSARLYLLDDATGEPLQILRPGSAVSGVALVHGRRLYVSTNGGKVLAWDSRPPPARPREAGPPGP